MQQSMYVSYIWDWIEMLDLYQRGEHKHKDKLANIRALIKPLSETDNAPILFVMQLLHLWKTSLVLNQMYLPLTKNQYIDLRYLPLEALSWLSKTPNEDGYQFEAKIPAVIEEEDNLTSPRVQQLERTIQGWVSLYFEIFTKRLVSSLPTLVYR